MCISLLKVPRTDITFQYLSVETYLLCFQTSQMYSLVLGKLVGAPLPSTKFPIYSVNYSTNLTICQLYLVKLSLKSSGDSTSNKEVSVQELKVIERRPTLRCTAVSILKKLRRNNCHIRSVSIMLRTYRFHMLSAIHIAVRTISYSYIVLPFIRTIALRFHLKPTLLVYSLVYFSLTILSIVSKPFTCLWVTWLLIVL